MSIEPSFHVSVRPFGSGADPLAMTVHVMRVHHPRTPHYGTKGQLLEQNPVFTLAEVLAEVERAASGLGAPGRAGPRRVGASPSPARGRRAQPENMT